MEDRIAEKNTEMIIGITVIVEIEVAGNLEKGHFQDIIAIIEGMIEVQAIVDQCQDQEEVQIEIELGVINVGNIIILQMIVLHLKKKIEIEQIQQMFNLEDQTSLKALATDVYDSLNKINSMEDIEDVQKGHLNL